MKTLMVGGENSARYVYTMENGTDGSALYGSARHLENGSVVAVVLALGLLLIACNLAFLYLSQRVMRESQRGARLLEWFICLGDLVCGSTVFAALIYPYVIKSSGQTRQGIQLISCVLTDPGRLVDIVRLGPVLVLVALARHFHVLSLFSSNDSRFSPSVAITPAILPTVFLLCTYLPHFLPMGRSLILPNFCMKAHVMPSVHVIMAVSTLGIIIAACFFFAMDHVLLARKIKKTKTLKGHLSNGTSVSKEAAILISSEVGYVDPKASSECLIPTDGSAVAVASDAQKSSVRTFLVVSLNGILLVCPLMLTVTSFLFYRENFDTSHYLVLLFRWTLLSIFNVLTFLYYTYMPMYL